MALEAVIFDVDGVLVQSMEKHHEAYARAFRPFGIELTRDEVFRNEGRGSREVAVWVAKHRDLKLTDEQLDQVARDKQRVFSSFGPMPRYPGVDTLVDGLRARGLRLAMVTGTSRVNVQNHFHQWTQKFDAIVTADDVQRTKPDPEPYLKALEKLGLRPEECLVVENAPLGIQSAKAAGLRVVAVTSTNPPEALKDADVVIERVGMLPGVLE